MAKKMKASATDQDQQLADAVRASAHQIWQAGLGAFAKAQEEGGRVFDKLVEEGTALQQRTRAIGGERMSAMTDTVSKASGSWDKLEQVFEERVVRALGALGVPTRGDIDALSRQVEQLATALAELSGRQAPAAPKARARKAAAPKPATK